MHFINETAQKRREKRDIFQCSCYENDKSSINGFGMVCQPISVRYFAAANEQCFVFSPIEFLLLPGKSLILPRLKLFSKTALDRTFIWYRIKSS
jgi:hypothetical protein